MVVSWRRMSRAGLIAAMMVVFIACDQSVSRPAPSGEDPLRVTVDGPISPYEETVQLSVWSGVNDIMKFLPGESIDDNLHTRYMKKKLNIEFINKWVADGSKIGEKVNLDIASNSLPDATQVNLEQLSRMMKNDQLEDLTDVWSKYATDGLKLNMSFQDNEAFKPVTKNGRIYGIPLPYDMGNSIAMMYVRADWLAELGLAVPKTMSELDAVVRAFTKDDPDRNGKHDTYGVAFEQGDSSGGAGGLPGGMAFDAIAAGYGVYPGLWVNHADGRLSYDSVNPKMIDVLTMLQQWYQMGAIDPEFAVKDLSRIGKDVQQGKLGLVFGPFHYPLWPLKGALEQNPNADWIVAPIPTVDGREPKPKALPFVGNWVVVRKGYEHPEALVKAMNVTYMMQAGIGEPGQFWENAGKSIYRDASAHLYMKPYTFDSPIRNLAIGKQIQEAIDKSDERVLTMQAAKQVYDNNIQSEDRLTSWAFKKVFYDAERVLAEYNNYQYSAFFDAPTPLMQAKGTALFKMEYESFTQLIMGAPLSSFKEFADKWERLGGLAIAQEVNKWAASKEENR
ncbi:extracellular solute-binding protein [Paenibacillus sp. GCM10023252]|uniref:extracellular solute-binding protein n=1 Tax=Paenibacillus sp. GCM10023252 TaxID=3252649 RepID=UPI00361C948F